ncbi:TIGR02281 family clan AA aspartic protease [Pseudoteredinibacter isoporae]|nr:TIGR02281 family clan AA aspartic protease [Pseudoteredinibacter isoporae]NIB23380.1 TIGR02281 family clan AA aspartic protease [Pseudoteredinibacter isoporae]
MMYLAWITALALLAFGFNAWLEKRDEERYQPYSEREGEVIRVDIEGNRQGHYLSQGYVNGKPVRFLLDTGATLVAVPEALARKLGMPKGQPGYANTANGRSRVYMSRIDRLELGDIRLQNVAASISTGMEGDEILLGMSALGQLEFTQRGRTLSLRQHRTGN